MLAARCSVGLALQSDMGSSAFEGLGGLELEGEGCPLLYAATGFA